MADHVEMAARKGTTLSVQVELPYADVCENNELRTYCISTSRYRLGMAERFHNR